MGPSEGREREQTFLDSMTPIVILLACEPFFLLPGVSSHMEGGELAVLSSGPHHSLWSHCGWVEAPQAWLSRSQLWQLPQHPRGLARCYCIFR